MLIQQCFSVSDTGETKYIFRFEIVEMFHKVVGDNVSETDLQKFQILN